METYHPRTFHSLLSALLVGLDETAPHEVLDCVLDALRELTPLAPTDDQGDARC